MIDKRARKFNQLLEAQKEARQIRKKAAAARSEVKGLDGRNGALLVLSSAVGAKAVEAELQALKAERRALKKLYAFSVKHAESTTGSIKAKAAQGSADKRKPSRAKSAESKPKKGKSTSSNRKAKAGAP